jgi:hypothetical protein
MSSEPAKDFHKGSPASQRPEYAGTHLFEKLADVIGMEMREQNDVDFFRRVAPAAEAARQAPECCPTPPGAGARIQLQHT